MSHLIGRLVEDFDNLNKIKVFDIQVTEVSSGNVESIIFDVKINEAEMRIEASHKPLSKEQENDEKISICYVDIDENEEDVSIHNLLSGLFDYCSIAIIEGDLYNLL